MARITQPADDPSRVELILEIRPWLKAAYSPNVAFSLPDLGGTSANSIYWIDVLCTANGAVLFYTRNLVQTFDEFSDVDCEELLTGQRTGLGLGDMYPDSGFSVTRTVREEDSWYTVEIDLNIARVFGASGDSWRSQFKLDYLDADQIRAFVYELAHEFAAARSGVAPDPACVPDGYGTLPFARQLNARAYDAISVDYGDRLFDDEMYRNAFEDWVAQLPPGGRVLDVGCGHGAPVVAELLERGFHVAGIDLSEGMLARAQMAFPAAEFSNRTAAEMTECDTYDGVCSFFSLLHADPIELRVALTRLRRALKPGGHLLIGSLMSDLSGRIAPMYRFKEQWVWGTEFSLEELKIALTEGGRFTIVRVTEDVVDLTAESAETTSGAIVADAPEPVAASPVPVTGWLSGKPARQWFTVLAQRPVAPQTSE